MNYRIHYQNLIIKSLHRTLTGYSERHHIIPKCMGGLDASYNIILLTPEEHFVAHLLLVKIFPEIKGLVYAARMMCISSSNQERNNKNYGWLKRKYTNICKDRVGSKNPSFGKYWFYDVETGLSGKFSPNSVPQGWIKGRKPIRLETTICECCKSDTKHLQARWCDGCRPNFINKDRNGAIKKERIKRFYTKEEKKQALIKNNGNIRKALYSLGLNDCGYHYKMMRELKASVFPHATNV